MAQKEVHLTGKAELDSVQHLDVNLQYERNNLILVYGGSYNPPHRGHIDVLLSGLRPEVGALAIVVLPCEDYLLRNKMVNSDSGFFLRMQRRAEVWDVMSAVPKDKVWIWPSTYFPFKPMIKALTRLAMTDGFKVDFLHMIGPDNLRLQDPLMILPYISPGILVSNKARHVATHFTPGGKPVVWKGFGPWSRGQCSRSNVGVPENTMEEAVLWTCEGIATQTQNTRRGYYLQFMEPNAIDINSTTIRGLLTESHHVDEINLNQLSTTALLELLAPVL
ncbi:hypothetical protein BLS_003750 [Venturia inaequalis]|uniref:Cytidyltransferase-like domain-containing protein n=1 Tax=Venturia inaequalis TaxID=5025 RepID=A0A8H3YI49_VENIN|nr:hypothetical protein BLS_003750 [Venturia inaequalis]